MIVGPNRARLGDVPPARVMLTALLCLLAVPPAGWAGGEGAAPGVIDVMFYYGTEEYYWGSSPAAGGPDAVQASRNAASGLNRGFSYEGTGGNATVEIGGLRPGGNDSWRWTLLSWDPANARWTLWTGDPLELSPPAGGAIAWCPSDTRNPTPNPLGRYPWPMDRCTATRRGETLSPAPLSNLTWWTASLNALSGSDPCVAGGRVFILSHQDEGGPNSTLHCLDETTGKLVWKARMSATGNGSQTSSPAFYDGRLFVGSEDGVFRALDARNGKLLWEFSCEPSKWGILGSPAVWRDRILFGGGDGYLYSLSPEGKLAWRTNLSSPSEALVSSPAVLGDRVVMGTPDGRLFCLELGNGTVIWNLSLGGHIWATPALSPEGYAFVAVTQTSEADNRLASMNLYSIFLRDGVIQWNASYPVSVSSPALAAGGLFIGTLTEFVGHHPDRGTRMWGLPYDSYAAEPAVARGLVYFTTSQVPEVVCVRVGGYQEWVFSPDLSKDPLNQTFLASAVIADGRLFAVTRNGTVLCLGRPPEPRVGARLAAPARAVEDEKVRVKASFNNTGEAPALFLAYLTVDGNRTNLKRGPFVLQPGESLNISFEWTAKAGKHALGLSFDGSDGTVEGASIGVEARSGACAITAWVSAVAAIAAFVPLMAGWKRGRRP